MRCKELWRKIKMKAKEVITTIKDCVSDPVNGMGFGIALIGLGLGVTGCNLLRYKLSAC